MVSSSVIFTLSFTKYYLSSVIVGLERLVPSRSKFVSKFGIEEWLSYVKWNMQIKLLYTHARTQKG